MVICWGGSCRAERMSISALQHAKALSTSLCRASDYCGTSDLAAVYLVVMRRGRVPALAICSG